MLLAALAGATGCSDDGTEATGEDAATAGTADDAATPGGGTLAGGVDVRLASADDAAGKPAFTSVLGKFFDGPPVPALPLTLELEQDGCQLLAVAHPLCDPRCRDAVCTADDVCTPHPTAQDVGTLHVRGLGDELVLDAIGSSPSYMPATSPPFPPCAEGAKVQAETDGVALEGDCIAPLALTVGDDPLPLMEGSSSSLTWEPPGIEGISRIEIVVDISHHGGAKGEIQCDVPDTGSFEIAQPLVDGLIALGVAGFPTVTVSRVSTAVDASHPDVSLRIHAPVEHPLDTGVPSCTQDSECPAGMTCNVTNFTCF